MKRAVKWLLDWVLISACAGAAFGHEIAPPPPASQNRQPFEIIRSMEAIQDQIVAGNIDAKVRAPKLIRQIAERLLAADPMVWRDARNARAAIIYVLSGGEPRVIRAILQLGSSVMGERSLMEGTLAYVEGRAAKAKQILLPLDPKMFRSSLGGHIALAQSVLLAPDDPSKAMQSLDQARLLSPGTLVEEAALRREIFLAGEMSNFDKFSFLADQYIRRFQKSAYADNFRRRFAASVLRFSLASKTPQHVELMNLLNELGPEDQLRLYLKIARSGIIHGKMDVARFAALQALRLAKDDSVEGARSRLYDAVTLILANSPDDGLRKLEAVDAADLSEQDADLKKAVAAIARQIQKLSDGAQPQAERNAGDNPVPPSGDLATTPSALAMIESTQRALNETDALLKRSAP